MSNYPEPEDFEHERRRAAMEAVAPPTEADRLRGYLVNIETVACPAEPGAVITPKIANDLNQLMKHIRNLAGEALRGRDARKPDPADRLQALRNSLLVHGFENDPEAEQWVDNIIIPMVETWLRKNNY